MRSVCAAALAVVVAASPASADGVETFYRGKTVRVVVGYGVGGGYDLYARGFAEFIGRFIPGNPTVIVQNMPGGGSLVAAKYLYGAAPRDGSYLGSVSQTLALDAAMDENAAKIDVTELKFIGRMLDNVDVGYGRPGAKFKTFDDARKMEITVGSTGGTSTAYLVPAALKEYGGAKFKIIPGYAGSAEVYLAAERGEVEMLGGVGLTFVMQRNPDWVMKREAPILYQIALKPHPLLPHVPLIGDLGLTPDGSSLLKAIASSSEIGRAILTTPKVPEERLAALRKAFAEMVVDPEFLKSMKKREIPIYAATGEELDEVTRDVAKTSPKVLSMLKKLLGS